jgi:hypothetical protein
MDDNFCSQFLPQERVSAIAVMNDMELLKEVEKAAGNETMLADHEQLISIETKTIEKQKVRLVTL